MRDRTADLFAASEALSQLSYSPVSLLASLTDVELALELSQSFVRCSLKTGRIICISLIDVNKEF